MGIAMVLGLPAWGTAGAVATVSPAHRVVALGSTLALSASETVTWAVLPQGTAPVGSISTGGVYTPPETLPPTGQVVARATSTSSSSITDVPIEIRSTTADGSFSAVGTSGVYIPVAGDVTGDGITDILDVRSDNTLQLKQGVGDGSYAAPTTVVGPGGFYTQPASIRLVDMDADGKLDLLVFYSISSGSSSTPTVEVWKNNGNATFTKTRSLQEGNWLRDVLAADFNGDGYGDIVVAGDTATNTVGYLPSAGAAAGVQTGLATGSTGATRLAAGDVNGDGRLDLVVQSWGAVPGNPGAPVVSVLLNNGTGFDAPLVSASTGPDNFPGPSIGLGDFNGDGRADLVIGGSVMGRTEVRPAAADGTFGAPVTLPDSAPGNTSLDNPFAVGHFNADNNLDLVVPTFAHGAQVFLGDGAGGFAAPTSVGGPAGIAVTANVDGDDKYDLVVFRDSNANIFSGGPHVGTVTKSITLTPSSAEANAGKSRAFVAQVSGTTDTQLDWFVNGVAGGNASIGTITGTGLNATYTAPDPTAGATTATIQAHLHSDDTIRGSATITLTDFHWSASSSGLGQSLWVRALAQSSDGATLYAGTNDGKVFRSIDGGDTWLPASGSGATALPGGAVVKLETDPTSAQVVWAGTDSGLYRSSNAGATWQPRNTVTNSAFSISTQITDIAISSDSQTMLVDDDNNLWRSTNAGVSFTLLTTGLATAPYPGLGARVVAADRSASSVFYASDYFQHLYKSVDGGATWTTPFAAFDATHIVSDITVDPRDPQHIAFVGAEVTRTATGAIDSYVGLPHIYETRDGVTTTHEVAYPNINNAFVTFTDSAGLTLSAGGPHAGPMLSTSASGFSFYDISTGMQNGLSNRDVYGLIAGAAGSPHPHEFYAATTNGIYIANAPAAAVQTPLTLTPPSATVAVGATRSFSTSRPATLSVVPQPGVQVGSVAGGVYTAPAQLPPLGSVRVRATTADGTVAEAPVAIRSTTGDGSFVPFAAQAIDGPQTLGDLDADGKVDAISVDGGALTIRRGLGDGRFGPPQVLFSGTAGGSIVRLGDINEDGRLDIVTLDPSAPSTSSDLFEYLQNADGSFTPGFSTSVAVTPRDLALVDVDGDGHLDFLVLEGGQEGIGAFYVTMLPGAGTGVPRAPIDFRTGGTFPVHMQVGDLNGDSRPDVVVTDLNGSSSGAASLGILMNNGSGFDTARTVALAAATFPGPQLGLGDLNGDGNDDVVVSSAAGGEIRLSNGDGTLAAATSFALPSNGQFALGHLNSDSQPDLVAATSAGLVGFLGDGTGGLGAATPLDTTDAVSVAIASLNGDGQYDLVARFYDGTRFLLGTLLGGPGITTAPTAVHVKALRPAVNEGQSLSLEVTVDATFGAPVEWYVNGTRNGSASLGTISVVDGGSAIYHAPATAGPLTQVTIQARLASNPSLRDAVTVPVSAYHWTQSTSGLGTSQWIRSLAEAADGSALYAGSHDGKVFKSVDGGETWQPASGSVGGALPGGAVVSLAATPGAPQTLYAGVTSGGVWKTVDGGTTWHSQSSYGDGFDFAGVTPLKIVVSPADANVVLAIVGDGLGRIVRSTDGGTTWQRVTDQIGGPLYGVDSLTLGVDHTATPRFYVSDNLFHVYRSSDNGATWQTPWPAFDLRHIAFRIYPDPNDAAHIAVVGWNITRTQNGGLYSYDGSPQIFETKDGGATFTTIPVGPFNSAMVAFAPDQAGLALAAAGPGIGPDLSTGTTGLGFWDISNGTENGVSRRDVYDLLVASSSSVHAHAFYAATTAGVFIANAAVAPRAQLRLTPSQPSVAAGGAVTFTPSSAATFSVLAQPGVDVGTITAGGVYTAPATLPPLGFVTVRALGANGAVALARVSIRSTSADGTFSPGQSLAGNVPHALADWNGDGRADLLTLTSGTLAMRPGSADGTFGAPTRLTAGYVPGDMLRVGDINGDGRPDIVTLAVGDTTSRDDVGLYYGNADGSVTPGIPRALVIFGSDLELADVTGDGNLDILVTDYANDGIASYYVTVLPNDGTGVFLAPVHYRTGGRPTQLALGDVNGDGIPDAVVTNFVPATGQATIGVLLGNGNGFDPATTFDPGTADGYPGPGLALGDLNGDGASDLVLSSDTGVLSVRLSNGDGTFAPPTTLGLPQRADLTLAHLDPDAHLDLIAAGADLRVYSGNGAGGFAAPRFLSTSPAGLAAVASLNGDGNFDLVVPVSDGVGMSTAVLLGGPVAGTSLSLAVSSAQDGVNAGKTADLAADVRGTLATAVDWYVNGVLNGDATVGRVVATGGTTARYTAPNPAPFTSVTIEGRLHATPSLRDSISLQVTDYHWSQAATGFGTSLDIRSLDESSDGARLYAGTLDGKVFRSTNGGDSWQNVTGNLPAGNIVLTIHADPSAPQTVYAGLRNAGLWKSTDAGATWTALNRGRTLADPSFITQLDGISPVRIEISPSDHDRLLVRTEFSHVYRSSDGGTNLYDLTDGPQGEPFPPDTANVTGAATGVFYAGEAFGTFVKSTDGGNTWQSALVAFSVHHTVINMSVDPADGSHILVVAYEVTRDTFGHISSYNSLPQVYESSDGGASFAPRALGPMNNALLAWGDTPGAVFAITGTVPPALSTNPARLSFWDVSSGLERASGGMQTTNIGVISKSTSPHPHALFVGTATGVWRTLAPVVAAAPHANAGGPYTARAGTTIALDASGSTDPAGDTLTYAWDLTGNGLFNDSTSVQPSFTSPSAAVAGTVFPICVRVTNSAGRSDTSCTTVTALAPITPPTAVIVPTQILVSGPLPVTVTFDASTSSDANGAPLTFAWTSDIPGSFDDPSSPRPSITVSSYGTYTAHVRVGNGFFTSTADALLTVQDVTRPTLHVPADTTVELNAQAVSTINALLASATASDDSGLPVSITNDYAGTTALGPHTVTFTATDWAGNTTQASFVLTVVVGDATPPVLTPSIEGTLGSDDWYTTDVRVSWSVTDPESPAMSTGCDTASVTTDTQATGVTFTCTATSAGGTTRRLLTIKRDATPPTITGARTPAANAFGWNNTAVTVTFTCSDTGSGLAVCPFPTVVNEGSDQSVTDTAFDRAGNSASATVANINVDTTLPVLTGLPTTSANAQGWFNGDVTVRWSCGDALSGIPAGCPVDQVITGEGVGLTAAASVSDRAGNVTAATSPAVRIDRTPPLTTASAPSGWTSNGVTISLSATDNLSGVDTTYYTVDDGGVQAGNSVSIAHEGTHRVVYWSVDLAGNVELIRTLQVMIDQSAPTITHTITPSPNSGGWNRSNVSVSFQCADAFSGIAFCTPVQLLLGEGRGLLVTGTARDAVGNEAHDTVQVSIDMTAPTIGASADRPANARGWYRADVIVGFACTDALSGTALCPAPVTVGEGRAQTVSGTGRDVAGNSATALLGGLNVDKTGPTVVYSGNAGLYRVDQVVSITCTAADALSGVASSTCANITGPAWSFGAGVVSRSASATDRADNVGTGTTSFVVGVTADSLCRLTAEFVEGSAKYRGLSAAHQHAVRLLTEAVCQKITEILPRLTPRQRDALVGAYQAGVQALVQVGYLTQAQATSLKSLADQL